jgi:2-oxoglutarate dehydrogenase E2 component (dihydrolipoamide succinyltransferase)
MTVELTIPSVGESITEVQIGEWLKKVGDRVEIDEPVVEIESAKVTVELPAPAAGVLTEILTQTGQDAEVGDVIGMIDPSATATAMAPATATAPVATVGGADAGDKATPVAKAVPAAKAPPSGGHRPTPEDAPVVLPPPTDGAVVMPAAQRVLHQAGVSPDQVTPTGPGGRLLKGDALQAVGPQAATAPVRPRLAPPPAAPPAPALSLPLAGATPTSPVDVAGFERKEWSVRMSPLRRTIAARLVQTKQETALLTTFNEIDMTQVMAMRKQFGEQFLQAHDIKLGFMSFFVKATVVALERFPGVNGEIRGQEIVYRNYADVGIAVGGGKGLVVPIVRDAQHKTFADLERDIADFGRRAVANKLQPEELEGGTFTISNGGVYGSLMSTPIPSPPQSGILGLHAIQKRPVAVDDQVVIRPMMYVALSYDHRIVDGKDAVTFLKTIKEQMEQPARMLLEV